MTFSGAAFCKHVCPVGQFNFVVSTLSPLELGRTRAGGVPQLRHGRLHQGPARQGRAGQDPSARLRARVVPAVEGRQPRLHVLPRLRAGVSARQRRDWLPRAGRGADRRSPAVVDRPAVAATGSGGAGACCSRSARCSTRSRWWARSIRPNNGSRGRCTPRRKRRCSALHLRRRARASCRWRSAAAQASHTRRLTRSSMRVKDIAVRYAYALIPFGTGVWLAHYGFHFLTGLLTIVPVTQSAAIDAAGRALLGEPNWRWVGMRPVRCFRCRSAWCCLVCLARSSLRTGLPSANRPERPARAAAPWSALILGLAVLALWILVAADGDERNGTRRMTRRVSFGHGPGGCDPVLANSRRPRAQRSAVSHPVESDRRCLRHLDLERSGFDRRQDGGGEVLGRARAVQSWRIDSVRHPRGRDHPAARPPGSGPDRTGEPR